MRPERGIPTLCYAMLCLLLPFSTQLISPISASSLFRDSWVVREKSTSLASGQTNQRRRTMLLARPFFIPSCLFVSGRLAKKWATDVWNLLPPSDQQPAGSEVPTTCLCFAPSFVQCP